MEPYSFLYLYYWSRYIVIRKSDHMPLFDESFLNYGYNKQQWIENLRYIGYKFGVVVQGFGMDVPHPVYDIEMTIIIC